MRSIAAAILVFATLAGLAAAGSGAATGDMPDVRIFGGLSPEETPGPGRVASTLRFGFTSQPVQGAIPSIEEISLATSKRVSFAAHWPQRCSLEILYAENGDPSKECATALIGHGNVTSEITIPGQAPVSVSGHLSAYAAYARGSQKILAQVTTGEPLPLVYVIPFEIQRWPSSGATELTVSPQRMQRILGECVSTHPNCFSDPYTLKGIYSDISKFEMSLHRVIDLHGKRLSYLRGGCVVPPSFPVDWLPFIEIAIDFTDEFRALVKGSPECQQAAQRSASQASTVAASRSGGKTG